MAATQGVIYCRIAGEPVELRGAEWHGESPILVRALNAGFGPGQLPLGYHPDRQRAQAEHACRRLGGRITADGRDRARVTRVKPGQVP